MMFLQVTFLLEIFLLLGVISYACIPELTILV